MKKPMAVEPAGNDVPENAKEALEMMRFGCVFKPNAKGIVIGDYDVPRFERRMANCATAIEDEITLLKGISESRRRQFMAAINYAIHAHDPAVFLKAWSEGDTKEWPDFNPDAEDGKFKKTPRKVKA